MAFAEDNRQQEIARAGVPVATHDLCEIRRGIALGRECCFPLREIGVAAKRG